MSEAKVEEVAATTAEPSGPRQSLVVKPGHRTTEFFTVALVVLVSVAQEIHAMTEQGEAANPWALLAAGVAAGAYALSRALAKRQS